MSAPTAPAAALPVVRGRSPGALAWSRLWRRRAARVAALVLAVIVLAAIFAPVLCHLLGIDPTTFHTNLLNPDTGLPVGPFSGASREHPLGIEPVNGRDILARLLYGARTSLLVAGVAAVVAGLIGLAVGVAAGLGARWVDTLLSGAVEVVLAFPVLLFSLAVLVVFQGSPSFLGLSGETLRLVLVTAVIAVFGWPYLARVVRAQVLSAREQDYVLAARGIGAGRWWLVRRELLPGLAGPALVVVTLMVPANILFEAALSFLGVGLQEPTSSWGRMLSTALATFNVDPWFMIVPGVSIVLTVAAFTVLGDSARDAVDAKSQP